MHWLIDDLVSSRQLQTLQEKTIPQDLLIHAKIATIATIEIWEVPGGHMLPVPTIPFEGVYKCRHLPASDYVPLACAWLCSLSLFLLLPRLSFREWPIQIGPRLEQLMVIPTSKACGGTKHSRQWNDRKVSARFLAINRSRIQTRNISSQRPPVTLHQPKGMRPVATLAVTVATG